MTSGEVSVYLQAHHQRLLDEWRRTRWLATIQANCAGAKVRPEQLMRLPGDEPPDLMTKEEFLLIDKLIRSGRNSTGTDR